jgi:hypothetical protein
MDPTSTSALPVALLGNPAHFQQSILFQCFKQQKETHHGGMEAKIGAKKMLMKKAKPVVMAVIPVRPPSESFVRFDQPTLPVPAREIRN